ncbi:FmdB family zinc ribbon protein [Syntrophorhabdus aromaticivorans]|uniref:Zinc ribbon domain-containing protein n=1 Tax=Syntrophorhabdus aromaticivorans TaxID=328301 RepID=A0A971M7K4_9BACT|nr:zinc ribbon domain-containing protein [Syntrophorhabdus aromaticivorans]NLW36626.1 zinc ribbon domain-containing protein [Syntrophorhabdus aromaticivorans]
MPIYEYRCEECRKLSSFLLLRASEIIEPRCNHCGSTNVRRVISRVTVLKSEEKRLETLLDPAKLSDFDENDPRSVERLVRRMGRELGDELGEDFEKSMEEALGDESSPSEDA